LFVLPFPSEVAFIDFKFAKIHSFTEIFFGYDFL